MLTGIISVVLIMFLAGNLPNTVCYVRRSQEQRENVTYVTRRRDKWCPSRLPWQCMVVVAEPRRGRRDSVSAGSSMDQRPRLSNW